MNGQFDLYGVFVPSLMAWMLAAFLLSVLLRRVLNAVGLYRFVWHRPLFDLALYVLLLGAVVATANGFSL
ncbi:DUF1656 domain-containing protein [Methyloligella sp. 2.7D]|uniref:DUF1656 domain-containing protein n=1 Tax=unclassified Methyloligella TaxID=2625955 RepID=UPI00157D96DD|nr:DUF1656 domain-containing protein [Methyloligella sp. GL2]QKP77245.1 DUF1656 domain-containing protein [Methyloligella sp. GL2]